jgi:TRAP-type mannitol/chloroaromatic compound transport system permease large subunit
MKSCLLLLGSALSLLGGVVTCLVGAWDGHVFDLRAESTFCTAKPLAGDGGGSFFPPSEKCRWKDGTTTELVPSFVNPLMLTLLVLGVVLLGIALVAVFRTEQDKRPGRFR